VADPARREGVHHPLRAGQKWTSPGASIQEGDGAQAAADLAEEVASREGGVIAHGGTPTC
jgi:hypothetical protein